MGQRVALTTHPYIIRGSSILQLHIYPPPLSIYALEPSKLPNHWYRCSSQRDKAANAKRCYSPLHNNGVKNSRVTYLPSSSVHIASGAIKTTYPTVPGILAKGKSGQRVALTTQPYIITDSRMLELYSYSTPQCQYRSWSHQNYLPNGTGAHPKWIKPANA
jgi:hypothetical protein